MFPNEDAELILQVVQAGKEAVDPELLKCLVIDSLCFGEDVLLKSFA